MELSDQNNEQQPQIASNRGIKQLNQDEKARILLLHGQGDSTATIAGKTGRNKSSIVRFINRWKSRQTIHRKKGSGRPTVVTKLQQRHMVRLVENDRFITIPEIKSMGAFANLSVTTISRHLKLCGSFTSYWAAKKPAISEENRVKRLNWCNEHLNWTIEQWKQVLWSDESPFLLRNRSSKRVWRHHNERYSPKCIIKFFKHDIKINVWGCFCATGIGELYRIEGILDQYGYLDILETPMQLSVDLLFNRENFLFQQDNDPKHTANSVKSYLAENDIPVMNWPAQSPDLNPIENLWSILEQKTSHRKVNTAAELFNCLQDAWKNLPLTDLAALVESMPRRCQAVIDANGLHTKY